MPSNIMVSESGQVTLIDFGLCTKYTKKDGGHVAYKDKSRNFKGNYAFASLD